jgi:hypothetical protein
MLFADIFGTLMADGPHQITQSVRASTSSTTDYGRLIRDVRRVDRDTKNLTPFMEAVCLRGTVGVALQSGPFAVVGFGPRPPPGHWWNTFGIPYVGAALTALLVLFAINGLAGCARITTACQQLSEAINELRASAGQGAEDDVQLATPEEILQINNVRYYIHGKCKGQGMGFALKGKRITYSLV